MESVARLAAAAHVVRVTRRCSALALSVLERAQPSPHGIPSSWPCPWRSRRRRPGALQAAAASWAGAAGESGWRCLMGACAPRCSSTSPASWKSECREAGAMAPGACSLPQELRGPPSRADHAAGGACPAPAGQPKLAAAPPPAVPPLLTPAAPPLPLRPQVRRADPARRVRLGGRLLQRQPRAAGLPHPGARHDAGAVVPARRRRRCARSLAGWLAQVAHSLAVLRPCCCVRAAALAAAAALPAAWDSRASHPPAPSSHRRATQATSCRAAPSSHVAAGCGRS